MLEQLMTLDTDIFLFLNGIHSPIWDEIMWVVSGKLTWIPLYLTVLFFVFKQYKLKGFLVLLFLILLVTCADQISVKGFKNVFERLRPSQDPALEGLVRTIKNYKGGKYGFVSSHAANTFAFAMFTALFFRKRLLSFFIFFWAAFVSYSRIYLGVHYTGDILCGALLGVLIGLVIYKLYKLTDNQINIYKQKYIKS